MNKLFNKFLSVFVLFLLLFSTATFTSAESGSNSGDDDSDDDSTDVDDDSDLDEDESELEDESEDELEDESEEESEEKDDDSELEDESEDELEDESEDEDEAEDEDEMGDDSGYSSGPSNACEKVLYLEKKLFKLNNELIEESEEDDALEVSEVESDITEVKNNLARARDACASGTGRTPAGIAVGRVCEISDELKQSLVDVKEKYLAAIESKDFEAAKSLRVEGEKLQKQIMDERRTCMEEKIPGLLNKVAEKCDVPEELNAKLDRARNRLSELEAINTEIPAELKKDITELEDKIGTLKAKCNALKVDSNVDGKKIREYYNQRLSEALENEDEDTKIQELKELRKEIDETIKNLVESKKKLKFEEVDGLVKEVKFKAKSTMVGDSETTEDVEVEVEIEDSSVTVESTEDEVLLTENGVEFTADDITVDENGISVNGVLVKKLPSDVFENNKNLERNAKRILKMKLEAEGEKLVYKTEYESKRKLFGFIAVKAKNGVTTDAETGETVSEDAPWWNGLSSESEDTESESETIDEDDDSDVIETISEDTETGVA